MSKFLTLVENYNPENSTFVSDVHDLKMLLKSHGIKFGVSGDGVFYIDDAANEKTYVVKIVDMKSSDKEEEDNEAYDVVDATSSISPQAAAAKANFIKTAKPKIPKAIADLNAKTVAISKM
jgi:hypothetical protein